MKRIRALLWILIATTFAAGAQNPIPAWPTIPPEDLALKESPAGKNAPAIILDRRVESDDNTGVETHYERLKILTKEGTKYADGQILYNEKRAEVLDARARVTPPGGAPAEVPVELYDKVVAKARRLQVTMKVFTIPGAEPGAILEYRYTLRYKEKVPQVFADSRGYIIDRAVSYPTFRWDVQQELFTRHAYFVLHPFKGVLPRWSGLVRPAHKVQFDTAGVLEVRDVPGYQEEEYSLPGDTQKEWVQFFYTLDVFGAESYWSSVSMTSN